MLVLVEHSYDPQGKDYLQMDYESSRMLSTLNLQL